MRSARNGDDEQQAAGDNYVGFSSSEEARIQKAAELERTARHDKKRRVGVPATALDRQGDTTANQFIQTAIETVGRALDTIFCPGRVEGQPRRAGLMVDTNKVEKRMLRMVASSSQVKSAF